MKKRSSPAVLLSVLGVMLLVAFGFAALSNGLFTLPEPKPEAPATPAKEQEAPSTSHTAANVKEQLARSKQEPEQDFEGRPGAPGRTEKPGMPPSILLDRSPTRVAQPKPNDSSTSTQWYNQESMSGSR